MVEYIDRKAVLESLKETEKKLSELYDTAGTQDVTVQGRFGGERMSKPRYKWWGYIKNVIRDYPRLKQEYEALHDQSVTPNMSGMPGGGGTSRAVENLAIRELPKAEQRDYEAVQKAINGTQRLATGEDRLILVKRVFWQNIPLKDAAYKGHISYDTACGYHWEFIMLVAYHKDLITYDELKKAMRNRKKITLKSQKTVLK